jgi:AraC family transcriptional regulator, regulatory protein of adaptative response / methylated-DNA-[protein]-cysteine methyltransferase
MLKISSTVFQEHTFSVIYDTHIMFAGFFNLETLPSEFALLNLSPDSSSLAKEVCAWYEEDKNRLQTLPRPIQLTGTTFQEKVWHALQEIPKGEVCTYTRLALAIRHPSAVRAVGTACGKNPISLIIPCHRVLGISSLGGYRWGLNIKKSLLSYETQHNKTVAEQ